MRKNHAFMPRFWGAMIVGMSMLAWTGCTNTDEVSQDLSTELQLSATLPDDTGLRATGTQWDNRDRIGIYAYNSTSTLSATSIVDGADNLLYITGGDGNFRPEGKAIRTLTDGTLMNLIAYYPYRSDIVGYAYPIDLRKQEDVFYSNNISNFGDARNSAVLQFGHVLSQLRLNISSKDGKSLDGLSVVIENSPVTAVLSLANGQVTINQNSVESLPLEVQSTASGKRVVGLLLPGMPAKSIRVRFSIGGQNYTWAIPDQMVSGRFYQYEIKLDNGVSASPVFTGVSEMPVFATNGGVAPNSAYVMHLVESASWVKSLPHPDLKHVRNYSILYDTKNRLPYWVAYPMHPMYLATKNRTDDWGPDPKLDRSVYANLSSNWTGPGDYNRGHMLASADRNYSRAINRTTFYYSNMAPQDSKMNGGQWAQLEEQVRAWCKDSQYDTLYVVTGNIMPLDLSNATKLKDTTGKLTTVPEYCYKALMHKNLRTGEYSTIGFKMQNISNAKKFAQCVVSVEQLEQETGFKFFNTLPADKAKVIKQNKNLSAF